MISVSKEELDLLVVGLYDSLDNLDKIIKRLSKDESLSYRCTRTLVVNLIEKLKNG